jgi:hypothetical protein
MFGAPFSAGYVLTYDLRADGEEGFGSIDDNVAGSKEIFTSMVEGLDGNLYAVPFDLQDVLVVDTTANSSTRITPFCDSESCTGYRSQYVASAVANNGLIFAVPFGQLDSARNVLVIDYGPTLPSSSDEGIRLEFVVPLALCAGLVFVVACKIYYNRAVGGGGACIRKDSSALKSVDLQEALLTEFYQTGDAKINANSADVLWPEGSSYGSHAETAVTTPTRTSSWLLPQTFRDFLGSGGGSSSSAAVASQFTEVLTTDFH